MCAVQVEALRKVVVKSWNGPTLVHVVAIDRTEGIINLILLRKPSHGRRWNILIQK
ncbi:hypothetical protein D3C84_1293260 [compost metagenome]